MFRAEILWLANGPTVKLEGRLVGEWAEQARCLVTNIVPKGLIVDLTEVSYVDSAGERLLSWLGSIGAVFAATGVCNGRMRTPGVIAGAQDTSTATGRNEEKPSITHSHAG